MGTCLIIKSGGGTDTSNATATTDKILSGYTIYSNDNKITGSMTNVGTQTASGLNASGSTTIKAGWHNGDGTVTTNSLSSQTQCDIPNQWWCFTGYSYWANGSKYDGLMVNRGTKKWTLGANGSQTIEDGWHTGSGTVSQSISVGNGEWGPTPTTTNQQLCWQGWYYSKNRWCWGNGNLVAGNIKKGVSIFGITGNYVETKRYLIQNGVLTGLCASDFIGQGRASTSVTNNLTYTANGISWRLVSCDGGYDGDGGSWWALRAFLRFKNINKLASFTNGKWGCRIHGEFYTSATAGGYGGNMYLQTYWAESDNILWYGRSSNNSYAAIPIAANVYGGNATISFAHTKLTWNKMVNAGITMDIGKWIHGQVAANDFFIYFTLSGLDGSDWRWLWAKNLWLETTETTP